MPPVTRKRSEKTGLPPGTLIHIGEQKTETVRITIIEYNEDGFTEREVVSVEECFPFKAGKVTWISVDGLHDVEVIEKLGSRLNFHPLLCEDILNTEQRPKLEDYGDYIYVVLRQVFGDGENRRLDTDQVSLIVGAGFLVSFQEQRSSLYEPVLQRLKNGKGRIRGLGADFLAYALIDTIVDNYFNVLEEIEDRIDALEEQLVATPNTAVMKTIHDLKRQMIQMRKSIWPLREVVNGLQRYESPLIGEATSVYLRDLYDHLIQIIDTVEALRDILSGMIDIYLSSISNRMNEIMKVLTIIATIFIPLTFVAGVFGMNFKYMPELEWIYGYPLCLLLMVAIALYMLSYFKKKKWI